MAANRFFAFSSRLATTVVAVATAMQLATPAAIAAASTRPPNIIFILADDVGLDNISCYGADQLKTPNIDTLAAGGTRFQYSYSAPLCGPSRAEILTGRYPFRTGMTANSAGSVMKPQNEIMLPRMLKPAGYVTAQVGKWHQLPLQPSEWGFDEYLRFPGSGCYWREQTTTYTENGEEKDLPEGVYLPDIMHNFLVDFIQRHKDQPFYVHYAMSHMHSPIVPTPDSKPGSTSLYADNVAYMDKLVGKLMAELDRLGLRENTVVIYVGDNGTVKLAAKHLTLHRRPIDGYKGTMLEGGSRVPLIVNWKGTTPAGQVCHDLTDFSDFVPTLVDLAGGEYPNGVTIDGRSFAPQVKGQTGDARDWVYVQLDDLRYVATKQWKLSNDEQMFNMKNAPYEQLLVPPDTTNAAAESARLRLQFTLSGMTIGPTDDFYLSDAAAGTVDVATSTDHGSSIATFASGLPGPRGVTFDKLGNLYVDASGSGEILKIAPDRSAPMHYAHDSGRLDAIAFDPAGNLFVADYDLGTIDYFTTDGVKHNYAVGLSQPAGLAFDRAGHLYATEHGTGTITKYSVNGVPKPFASGFSAPTGIVIDPERDSVYVVEENGSLYQLDSSGGTIAKIAKHLTGATGLTLDLAGNVYVAENAPDRSGKVVTEKITPNGAHARFTAPTETIAGIAIAPTGHLANISARLQVHNGDKALITGFITRSGGSGKRIYLRALGPSLHNLGLSKPVEDPTLQLYAGPTLLEQNDNWNDSNASAIAATGIPPTDDRESAMVTSLPDGAYTAIERGEDRTLGLGLLELYDLDASPTSEILNVSTRGFVGTGENVLIGGFIISGGQATLLVRGLGPSLAAAGVRGTLENPTLSVRDANGALVAFSDDWKNGRKTDIEATGLAPTHERESACIVALGGGNYTAAVSGADGGTGVGLVEVYKLK
jgi:arylsulfatase A